MGEDCDDFFFYFSLSDIVAHDDHGDGGVLSVVIMSGSIKFLFSVFPCGGSSIQIENRGIQQPDPGDF